MSHQLIKQLQEKRANTWEQAKALLDSAAAEKRDLTAEEDQSWQRMNADLDSITARMQSIADAEKREADVAAAFAGIASRPVERGAVSMNDQLRKLGRGEIRDLSIGAAELRDLTKGVAASGGATVPAGFYGQLWEHMVDAAAIIDYCTLITTDGGNPIVFPVTTGHSAAALIAENATITESDPTFAARTLSSYKYAVAVQVPTELVEDTGVDLEGYLARQMGRAVGNDLGEDLMVGNAAAKPSGLFQTSTLGVTGGAGVVGAPTADNLIDLFYSVIAPYRNSSKAAWVMKDATVAAIRKFKDTTNQYLWVPGLAGAPDTLLGKPIVTDPYVAGVALSAKSVAFGDLSAYYVRVAGGLRFEKSTDFAFGSDQITYRAIMRADGVLLDQAGAVKHFIGNAA